MWILKFSWNITCWPIPISYVTKTKVRDKGRGKALGENKKVVPVVLEWSEIDFKLLVTFDKYFSLEKNPVTETLLELIGIGGFN